MSSNKERVLEPQLRRQLELLAPPAGTLIEVLGLFGVRFVGFFDDKDKLCNEVRKYAGRGNLFIGVNPRSRRILDATWAPHNRLAPARHRASREHIHSLTGCLLDLDVVTRGRTHAKKLSADRKAAATKQEVERVIEAAQLLVDAERLECTVIHSGNGVQLLLPFDGDDVGADDMEAWSAAFGRFGEELVRRHARLFGDNNDYGCKLDVLADSPRIMTLVGVRKRKGPDTDQRPHRLTRILKVIGDPLGSGRRDMRERLLEYMVSTAERPRRRAKSTKASGELRRRSIKPRDAPFECELWNRIYRDGPWPPREGRSGTLYALARKLVADEFDRDDAVDVLHEADHAHFDKFSSRANPTAYYDSMLDTAESEDNLDCAAANKAFFRDSAQYCDQCTWRRHAPKPKLEYRATAQQQADGSRRNDDVVLRGPAQIPVHKSRLKPKSERLTVDEAREEIRDAIIQYLAFEVRLPPTADRPPPVLLLKGPPGLGKSTLVRDHLPGRAAFDLGDDEGRIEGAKETLRYTILAPYGDLRDEIGAQCRNVDTGQVPPGRPRILPTVKVIKGKIGSGLCSRESRILRSRKLGYGSSEYTMACARCPDRSDCAYLGQFQDRDHSWLMVMHYAATSRLLEQHDNNPDVFVCDEGLLGLAVQRTPPLSASDLREAAAMFADCFDEDHRHLAHALESLADYAERETAPSHGQLLRMTLEEDHPELPSQLATGLDDEAVQTFLRRVSIEVAAHLIPRNTLPLLESLNAEFREAPLGGRVWLSGKGYEVRSPAKFVFGDRPLIILDSTGDPAIYERILGRCVEVVDPHVELACPVFQLLGNYSKTTLGKPRVLDPLLDLIEGISRATISGVAVVCHKDVEPRVRDRLAGHVKVVLHYYAARGTNRVVDAGCSDIVLLGTPNPNPEDLAKNVAALDLALHHTDVEWRFRRYHGTSLRTQVMEFRDPALRPWHRQAREAEMVQALFRLRPLDKPLGKRIWIFSHVPLPGITPTSVFKDRNDLSQAVELAIANRDSVLATLSADSAPVQ